PGDDIGPIGGMAGDDAGRWRHAGGVNVLPLSGVVEALAQLCGEQLDFRLAQFQVRERGDRLNLRPGKSSGHGEMLASLRPTGAQGDRVRELMRPLRSAVT